MSEQQRGYVQRYMKSLKGWREKSLGERMCHNLAAATAADVFRLSPEEQREVDAWLDEKFPERKAEGKPKDDGPPSLFSLDLPEAD